MPVSGAVMNFADRRSVDDLLKRGRQLENPDVLVRDEREDGVSAYALELELPG